MELDVIHHIRHWRGLQTAILITELKPSSRSNITTPSIPHRTPVLPRVRSTDQHAALEVDPDRLVAAEASGAWGDPMTLRF
jgi:hypothetical protein